MNNHTIGIIGIGLLGTALAERLLGAGFAVSGFDNAPEGGERLQRLGGTAAPSVESVLRDCPRVIFCLPTSDIVERVVADAGGELRAGSILVDATTGHPEQMARLGARLAQRGIQYLDATISGSSEQVRMRDAIVMAGGDARAFEECTDLFQAFARKWFHLGPCGAGATFKLVTNLVLGLNRAVLAEGLAFAAALGLDLTRSLEVLRESAAYSRVMDTKGRKMLERDYTPQAKLAQHLKDVELILERGTAHNARLPFSSLHRELLVQLTQSGFAEKDNCAVIEAFNPTTSKSSEPAQ